MWKLEDLMHFTGEVHTCSKDGNYMPARPLNGTRAYASLWSRLRDAWAVFTCRAEAFTWPGGQ